MSDINQVSLPAEILGQLLESIAYAGLAFLFNKIEERLKGENLDLGEISQDGFNYGKFPNLSSTPTTKQVHNLRSRWLAEKTKASTALDRLEKTSEGKSDFLALHVDECQVILAMFDIK